jgi:BirA family biotin operon repressor/biotin-[acetyl-CoA-carboxylase] ligase
LLELISVTGSTNADLAGRLRGGERIPEGYWLVADRQDAGKGRCGRDWYDGAGNFMGSTVVHIGPLDPPPPTLSFVAALALYDTVAEYVPNPIGLILKWPNDLLLSGAKLAGILLEGEGRSVVVGIGVNLAYAPALVDRVTIALADQGPAPDRDIFAARLAGQFAAQIEKWRGLGKDALFERWRSVAHPPGTMLTVKEPDGQEIFGAFDGLGPDGALRLRLADGSVRVIHAGDVIA